MDFCGSIVEVERRDDSSDAKESFRLYDDGFFKGKTVYSRHPNVLKGVITGKKGWGLWLDQWTDGIVEWSLTKDEALSIFREMKINIPESFLLDFENTIDKKKRKRNLEYLDFLKKEL